MSIEPGQKLNPEEASIARYFTVLGQTEIDPPGDEPTEAVDVLNPSKVIEWDESVRDVLLREMSGQKEAPPPALAA